MTSELVRVPFHQGEILAVKDERGEHVVLAPLCDSLSINTQAQVRRIRREAWGKGRVAKMAIRLPGDDRDRQFWALDRRRMAMWAATISINAVREEVRPYLALIQNEAADVLDAYFMRSHYPSLDRFEELEAKLARVEAKLDSQQNLFYKLVPALQPLPPPPPPPVPGATMHYCTCEQRVWAVWEPEQVWYDDGGKVITVCPNPDCRAPMHRDPHRDYPTVGSEWQAEVDRLNTLIAELQAASPPPAQRPPGPAAVETPAPSPAKPAPTATVEAVVSALRHLKFRAAVARTAATQALAENEGESLEVVLKAALALLQPKN
jgi:hypothetical protein